MLSEKKFKSLQVGDIALFNGRPRTVREVRWSDGKGYITFSILRRSWTGRVATTYSFTAVKRICSMPRKERDGIEVCRAEEDALLANGFDVLAGVEREISDAERLKLIGFGCSRESLSLLKKSRRQIKRRKIKRRKNA